MPTLDDIIKAYGAIPELSSFKRPMFVGPHPDDIEFCCGALVSKYTRQGTPVSFLIATDGAAGTDDPELPPEKLKETRQQESVFAAAYLGVGNVTFCELEDGGDYTVTDAMKAIAPHILRYHPDILFVCDPKLRTECHPDHLKIGEAVRRLTKIVPYPVACKRHGIDIEEISSFPSDITLAFYASDDPNVIEAVTPEDLERKITSLSYHVSQTNDPSTGLLLTYFRLKAMKNGEKTDTGLGEDYQVIVPLCQHVYSEGIHYND